VVLIPLRTLKRGHSPSRSGDNKRLRTDDQDGWLFELHSKIWNRKDLKHDLFHKLEITAVHYVELQKRLGNLYPNRNSENYRNGDVLSIKLNILQSFVPSQEALIQFAYPGSDDEQIQVEKDEDKEDNYGMDDELRAFFPATVTYLDLSSLKLKKPPLRLPVPLLIRQEYIIITNMLNELPEGNAGSVIISGQPGTGEALLFFPL
jgi:hypothetical protein